MITGAPLFTLAFVFALSSLGQDHDTCPLSDAKNGDRVRFNAEAIHSAHDGILRINGCKDDVVFEYADNPDLGKGRLVLKADESLRVFREHFNAQQVAEPNSACIQCGKYRVTAEFEGRLDITNSAGWKKDAKTGKLMGPIGFGHPMPFTRYRLVITSVADVHF